MISKKSQRQINKTNWGNVAESYDKYINKDKNYHTEVVMPNLFRMIGPVKGKRILDIACGQGQISNQIYEMGAKVEAFDAGRQLIEIAKKNNTKIKYIVADAESFAKEYYDKESDRYVIFDTVLSVLAIQNIENLKNVLNNIKLVSDTNTKIYFVINHPSFRIPQHSAWGFDTDKQYRRVDKYMSEDRIKIDMKPGESNRSEKEFTYSYHRPLQYYFKLFSNSGFVVSRLEEWISNRVSVGKNSARENIARKEFPLFMCLELRLLK